MSADKPEDKRPEDRHPETAPETTPGAVPSRAKIRILGREFARPAARDFVPPLPEVTGARAFAALAAASGAALAASNVIPKLKPLSLVLKASSLMALGAADAKKMLEREAAWENHLAHAQKLAAEAGTADMATHELPKLEQRDVIILSFLPDEKLELLAPPVRAEVLRVQVLMDVHKVKSRGLFYPEGMKAFSRNTQILHTAEGVSQLLKERTLIRDILDGKQDGKFDSKSADANARDEEMKSMMRLAALEALSTLARRAGRYGKYLSGVLSMTESAQVLKDSFKILAAAPEKTFEEPSAYLEHLEKQVLRTADEEQRRGQSFITGYLPGFKGNKPGP